MGIYIYAALPLYDAVYARMILSLCSSTLIVCRSLSMMVSRRGSDLEAVGSCWERSRSRQRAWGMFPQSVQRVGLERRLSRLDQCEGC